MQFSIDLSHLPPFLKHITQRSLLKTSAYWSNEVLGKPITIDSLDHAEVKTRDFIDNEIKTRNIIPEFSRFYWEPRHQAFSSWRDYILYNNLFDTLLNNNSCLFASLDLSSEPKKQENAIKTIYVGLSEFALIESENQHAFITHTDDLLKVGQIITIFNPNTDKSIIVEIDKITKSKHNQFINEFSLVDFY